MSERDRRRPWFRDAVVLPTPIELARFESAPRDWTTWAKDALAEGSAMMASITEEERQKLRAELDHMKATPCRCGHRATDHRGSPLTPYPMSCMACGCPFYEIKRT